MHSNISHMFSKMTPAEFDQGRWILHVEKVYAIEEQTCFPQPVDEFHTILGIAIKSANAGLVEHIACKVKLLKRASILNAPCSLYGQSKQIESTPLVECYNNFHEIDSKARLQMATALLVNGADVNQPSVNILNSKRVIDNPLSACLLCLDLPSAKLLIVYGAHLKNLSFDCTEETPYNDENRTIIVQACKEICSDKGVHFNGLDEVLPELKKLIISKLFAIMLKDIYGK